MDKHAAFEHCYKNIKTINEYAIDNSKTQKELAQILLISERHLKEFLRIKSITWSKCTLKTIDEKILSSLISDEKNYNKKNICDILNINIRTLNKNLNLYGLDTSYNELREIRSPKKRKDSIDFTGFEDKILQWAIDPKMSMEGAAKILLSNYGSLNKYCRENNIHWTRKNMSEEVDNAIINYEKIYANIDKNNPHEKINFIKILAEDKLISKSTAALILSIDRIKLNNILTLNFIDWKNLVKNTLNSDEIEQLKNHAKNPDVGKKESCDLLKISLYTHRRILFEKNIQWVYCKNDVNTFGTNISNELDSIWGRYYSPKNDFPYDKALTGDVAFIWLCEMGHERIQDYRQLKHKGCPYCSGKKFIRGINDFETFCLNSGKNNLLNEWNINKNLLKASDYSIGSMKLVHWKCKNDHEFTMSIARRSGRGDNCPQCRLASFVSSGEKELSSLLFDKGYEIITQDRKIIAPFELDILIPRENIAIEFNGDFWHSNEWIMKSKNKSAKKYHEMKYKMCLNAGVNLLFVWEWDWLNNRAYILNKLDEFFKSGHRDEIFMKTESILDNDLLYQKY